MLAFAWLLYFRGGTTASRDTRAALPLYIQTAIVKLSICLSTVKAGYRFDIWRNERMSTDKSSEHQGPWSAPHFVSVLVLSLLLYLSLNFALQEHPRDQRLCRPLRKVEVNAYKTTKSYTCPQ